MLNTIKDFATKNIYTFFAVSMIFPIVVLSLAISLERLELILIYMIIIFLLYKNILETIKDPHEFPSPMHEKRIEAVSLGMVGGSIVLLVLSMLFWLFA